ncbi:uncharacterized protein LOC115884666 [Sitophilus oryzae]|uniref:Uncharacterized protein LOC115884666 n=1 Tax=Sitophilus oryzae TaxID=7048 RepID=A0A6J2Y6D1_SITOR|nr:uncharacterized protein LOC115884666 [Sitophilus oryzae]
MAYNGEAITTILNSTTNSIVLDLSEPIEVYKLDRNEIENIDLNLFTQNPPSTNNNTEKSPLDLYSENLPNVSNPPNDNNSMHVEPDLDRHHEHYTYCNKTLPNPSYGHFYFYDLDIGRERAMADDVHVCVRCSDNFIVNQKFLKCNGCSGVFHYHCTGLKDAQCKFIGESDSVMWFCDQCCELNPGYPAQGLHNNTSDITNLKCEISVLRKEVDCLNREKCLLNKLLTEMECSTKLLKSRLEECEQKIINDKNAIDSNINNNTSIKKGISYSSALTSKVNNESAVLLIKSSNNALNSDEVLKNVTGSVNPADLKVCINNTKKIKNGMAIMCQDSGGLHTLRDELQAKLGSRYVFSESKKFNPRMLIKNVRVQEPCDETNIVDSIYMLNDLSAFDKSDFKLVTRLKNVNNSDLLVEVSPLLRKFLLSRGFLWVSWKKSAVVDHLHILRCYNCCQFGHTSKNCKNTLVCWRCSASHQGKDCQCKEEKCVNCHNHNLKYKTSWPVNHSVKSSDCHTYNDYVLFLKSRIIYD